MWRRWSSPVSHRPHVVLMDIRTPELDGIEATRRICAAPETAGVRVLVLTTTATHSSTPGRAPKAR